MKVNFYLDNRSDKDGFQLIRMFISFQGERFGVSTGKHCKPADWIDKDKKGTKVQRMDKDAPGATEINKFLDSLKAQVEKIERTFTNEQTQAIDEGEVPPEITVNYIKSRLPFIQEKEKEPVKKKLTFLDYYDKYVEQQKEFKEWSRGTIGRMDGFRKHLVEMDKIHPLSFESIDSDFYMKFIKYQKDKGFNNNYIKQNIGVLKWFLKWATEEGYNKYMYYARFKHKTKLTKKSDNIVKLDIEELLHLYKLKIDKPNWAKTKDVFIFQCFTGMRYSELKNLKKSDIQNDTVSFVQEKTGKKVNCPLHRYSKPIWNKYKDEPGDNAFPVLSNSNYNLHLKEIGKLAEFESKITKIKYQGNKRIDEVKPKWAKLTTHVARKTFLSTAVYLKIPLEIAIEITSQTYETARRYYKVDPRTIEEQMKKFNKLRIA